MKQLKITTILLIAIALTAFASGCNEPEEDENEEETEEYRLPFSCPSTPEPYRDFITDRGDHMLRDELEQIALSHFDESCLSECELTGDMTECLSGSCPTLEGGTVEYSLIAIWEPDSEHDPAEGSGSTTLTIIIENPAEAELQRLELTSETRLSRGVEDDHHGLDLTVSWVGSLSEDLPDDGSLTYAYSGRTFDGCFYTQTISSTSSECSFEVEVSEEAGTSCMDSCDFTATPEGGDEVVVTDTCPPYSLL